MRPLLLSLTLAAILVPAVAAAPSTGFEYGRTGGSIRPYSVLVSNAGKVGATGAAPAHRAHLTKQQLANLNRAVFDADFAHLPAVTSCPGTLPDIAAEYIRVGNRTVRVHGDCLKRFNRLWATLEKTVGR
jgi:hypothetical protein